VAEPLSSGVGGLSLAESGQTWLEQSSAEQSFAGQPTLFPLPFEMEFDSPEEAEWSRRYMEAGHRYVGLNLGQQEAVHAVIAGLEEWSRLIPQRSVCEDGLPELANKWSLGVERGVLRAFHSHLVANGQPLLAARIDAEMEELHRTADMLDTCCMKKRPGSITERRLVVTARVQVLALVNLLSAVRLEIGKTASPLADESTGGNGDERTAEKTSMQPPAASIVVQAAVQTGAPLVVQTVELVLGPKGKKVVRRQVKAEIKTLLTDDVCVAAYKQHNSYRKAADALTEETGRPISKDKIRRAVERHGGIAAIMPEEDSDSIARTVTSQRHDRGRKNIERR